MARVKSFVAGLLREALDEMAVLPYLNEEEQRKTVAGVLGLLSKLPPKRGMQRTRRVVRDSLNAFLSTGNIVQLDRANLFVSALFDT